MDNIDKFLKKIDGKKRIEIEKLVERIAENNIRGLDCKKLKSYDNFFRVRKGGMIIIFQKGDTDNMILSVEYRSDNTYRK